MHNSMSREAFTKAQRKEIRRLAGVAYERELSAASAQLESEFARWRKGEIDVFGLNELIHKFHNGASRDLYKVYAMGEAHWGVASAIARGLLTESEVDPAILESLSESIQRGHEFAQEEEEKEA